MQFPISMRVALGTFACLSIEARFGPDAAAGVEAALRHYTRRLRSGRAPIAVPAFCRAQAPTGASASATFDLDVGPEIEAALEAEAGRQGIPIDLLLAHAVFVYLAALDATVDDVPQPLAEEGDDLPRFHRRCDFVDTRSRAVAWRRVGSA